MTQGDRLLAFAGGSSGALGVALSALASHGASPLLTIAASFLLAHAPVFLLLGLSGAPKWFQRPALSYSSA